MIVHTLCMNVERYEAIVVQNAYFKKINTSFYGRTYRKYTNHIMRMQWPER